MSVSWVIPIPPVIGFNSFGGAVRLFPLHQSYPGVSIYGNAGYIISML